MIERERDESVAEEAPATHSTDPDDEQTDKDVTVDEQSEQSMDGSDAPAW